MIQQAKPQQIEREWDQQNPYIPIQMFRLIPQKQDRYFVGHGKSIRRFLFQGQAFNSLTPYQKQNYDKFVEFLQSKKKELPMGCINDPFWTESWKFRWLSSEAYDRTKTIDSIVKHTEYLKSNRTHPSQREIQHLKKGIFYICGRDAYYQPIMVFNVEKMINSGMTEQELLSCQKFFFEKVLNYYLLPGQVETWVAIIDVGYQNLFSLIGPLQSSISFLSNTYRSRMKIAYLVKCPTSISFLWSIAKKFMHEETIKKINFLKSNVVTPLLEFANPSQLQVQYGGSQPDIKTFWPLQNIQQVYSLDFTHKSVLNDFITKQEYNKMYFEDMLKQHIICNKLIEQVPLRGINGKFSDNFNNSVTFDSQGKQSINEQFNKAQLSTQDYIQWINSNLLQEERPWELIMGKEIEIPKANNFFNVFSM